MANVSNILTRDGVPSSKSSLRGYLHDTGVTFILEQVHSVSSYFFASVPLISRRNFVPLQVITVFIPNEILILVRNLIVVSCKLQTNFFPY